MSNDQWIDGDGGKKLLDEGFSSRATFGLVRTMDAP
jgi:hypothetical protein